MDLVITDVVMPIKEGIETICDIKRLFPDIDIMATVIDVFLYLKLKFAQTFGMGRGPARGAAVMGLPRCRRRGARHGVGQVLGTEYLLSRVIQDTLKSHMSDIPIEKG